MPRFNLFFKIYLTLLASLLVSAVISGLVWRSVVDVPDPENRFPRRLVEAMLPPPEAGLMAQREAISRIAAALDAEIMLRDPAGRRIALIGNPEDQRAERPGRRAWRIALEDGRKVIIRFDAPLRPPLWRVAAALLLVSLFVAIAAVPVVWLIVRRLNRLQRGVERWGPATLSQRVDAKGGDEVAALARSFNAAADRIEELIEAHRTLLANASHELRSPLARLRLALELQGGRPTAARKAEIIANMAEIDALVDELLMASRLDRPEIAIARDPVDLHVILAEEAARLGVTAAGVGAGTVAGTPAFLTGDAKLLRRLVRNLLENALRHGAPPVAASLATEGGTIRLIVDDAGKGVPEADRARVFEPFFRPKGHAESSGGWGLGLSLVRQIALRHGGGVSCGAAPSGGARFVVELPAAPQ